MLAACFSPELAVMFLMGSAGLPPVDVKRRVSSVTADLILVVLLWVALVAAKNKACYGKGMAKIFYTHNVVLDLFIDRRWGLVSFSLWRWLLRRRRDLFGSLLHCFGSRR